MVEDRITGGKRIAQLLSSELSGRETGPLAAVAVTDADPDAEPADDGTRAYAVTAADQRVGEAFVYPDATALALALDPQRVSEAVRGPDLSVERSDDDPSGELSADTIVLRVESGAAVKRAVDAVVAGLPEQ
jgi:hypothetical protein